MSRLQPGLPLGRQWANHLGDLVGTTNPFSSEHYSEKLSSNALPEARTWLSGVEQLNTNSLGVTIAAREARPHGAYPDEREARPIDQAVASFNRAFEVLERCVHFNAGASSGLIRRALEELTGLVTHDTLLDKDGAQQSAPLYTFLPEGKSIPMLASLTYAFGELAANQKEQRIALDYLDLVDSEIPKDPPTNELKSLRMVMHLYKGRALSRLDRVQRSVEHFQAAINTVVPETSLHVQVLMSVHAETISNRFKLALESLERNCPEAFDKEINKILHHRRDVEKLLARNSHILSEEESAEARQYLIGLRGEVGRHFWYLGLFNRAYRELYGIQRYGSDKGAIRLRKIIEGYGKQESSDTTWQGRMRARMGRWYRLATGNEFTSRRAKKIYEGFCHPDGTLIRPKEIKKPGFWKSLKPAFRYARWRRPRDMIVDTVVGGLGMGLGYYFVQGGAVSIPDAVQVMATGAMVYATGHRLVTGSKDPRAIDQGKLGVDMLSGFSALGSGARAFAPAALTYVALGGSIPGMAVVADWPGLRALLEANPDSAVAAGALRDPGTLMANTAVSFGNFGHSLVDLINGDHTGVVENLQKARRGTFVSVTERGLVTGYTDIVRACNDGRMYDRIAAAGFGRNSLMATLGGLEAASLAGLVAWRRYKGVRDFINNDKWGKRIGWAALPLGVLGAAHLATFLGAKPGYDWHIDAHLGSIPINIRFGDVGPLHLPWKMATGATIAAGFQGFHQWLNGSRVQNWQTANLVNKALLRSMVAGLAVNFKPFHASETVLDKMVEGGAKYMNVLPLLLLYGGMAMVDWRRYFQAKLASVALFKPLQYGGSLWVINDFAHPLAFLVRGTIEFFTTPWQQAIANDNAGTRPTRRSYLRNLDEADGQATQEIMAFLKRGLFRLPWDAPIRRWEKNAILAPFNAFTHVFKGKRIPGRLIPEEKNWALLYRMLMEEGYFSAKHVATLLSAFENFAPEKENADVARGLALLISIASTGWHAEQISGFMKTRRALFAEFGIGEKPPLKLPDILPTDNKREHAKKKRKQEREIYKFMTDERRNRDRHSMPGVGATSKDGVPPTFRRRKFVKAVGADNGVSRITREMKPVAKTDANEDDDGKNAEG